MRSVEQLTLTILGLPLGTQLRILRTVATQLPRTYWLALRGRATVSPSPHSDTFTKIQKFHSHLIQDHRTFPDCTTLIAEDRLR